MSEMTISESIFLFGMTSIMLLGAGSLLLFKEWKIGKKRDYEFRMRELSLKEEEIHVLRRNNFNDKVAANGETKENPDLGGYVTVEIPEEKKALFHDLLKGFEEYALLRGYKVSLSIDTTSENRISFKIVVLDFGITSTRQTIKADLNDYINKIKNGDLLDDIPEIIDPVEHNKIMTALKNRISFLQHNYEVQKNINSFYENFFHKLPLQGFLHSTPVFNFNNGGTNQVDQRRYIASNSANVMQGDQQSGSIESGSINIGITHSQKTQQIQRIDDVISELNKCIDDNQCQNAIRQFQNIKEELEDSENPDKNSIAKWLQKASSVLSFADKAPALLEKTKAVLEAFGFQ